MDVNIKKILLLFYVIVPIIFFSLPIVFIYLNGDFTAHFYGTFHADYLISFKILIGHLILGSFLLFSLKKTNYTLSVNYKSYMLEFFTVIIFTILLFVSNNLTAMLTGALFFVLASNIKLSKITLSILLLLAITDLVINQERIYITSILLLISYRYLTNNSLSKMLLFGFIGIFILIFVLQPLKYGELPFTNFTNVSESLNLILHHLFPIYYTAFVSQSMDFTTTSLIVEFIPLGKSLSGSSGIVEQLAFKGLPLNLIRDGARLGSNSSMYFSFIGYVLLMIMLIFIKFNLSFLKSKILKNSVLLYFILQGPYFIRRSFASFVIDIILIICWVFVVSGILIVLKNRNKKYEK